jgi:hypothetical protein
MNRETSVLGDVVRSVYDFLSGERTPRKMVKSPVHFGENIPAREFLREYGYGESRGYVVKQEHLPGDTNVCAILTKQDRVVLETSRVNLEGLQSLLREDNNPAVVKGKSIFYNGHPVITTRTQNVARLPTRDVRTVLTILPPYKSLDLGVALEVIDDLDNGGCYFDLEGRPSEGETSIAKSDPRMELDQQMLQVLQQRQVPMLALQQSPVLRRIIRASRILKMNVGELGAFVKREAGLNPALKVDS